MSTVVSHMTTEESLALPENGMDRDLYNGELRERPAILHGRLHASAVAKVSHLLVEACDKPSPRLGMVYTGAVGCILQRNPDTTVGVDVVYLSRQACDRQSENTTLIEGPPTLAVEVLESSDTHEEISRKVEKYLAAGTPCVWVIDPDFRTITVYSPDREPELFNEKQEITAEPHLPGFKVEVAKLFA